MASELHVVEILREAGPKVMFNRFTLYGQRADIPEGSSCERHRYQNWSRWEQIRSDTAPLGQFHTLIMQPLRSNFTVFGWTAHLRRIKPRRICKQSPVGGFGQRATKHKTHCKVRSSFMSAAELADRYLKSRDRLRQGRKRCCRSHMPFVSFIFFS